ncbi:MAG: 3-oxoacyl-[acyl-carrier-protein] reductase [Prochlorococcus marinus CUG1431]|uniref:3-oxoacyl-[acyl-carrier-protein] reductase n=1 Tax=Prochlorococcus marinus CUG1433 TaxID=2774506 RepID=A0A9D9G4W8_PROMR|nr:3-oxoacyl-[acyl-carrier-protein] reductase [Prochlorococcus marinus CUG1433]MBO6980475.1 3-oxoacyl-[acyl-carrier-protein] reductase [Prochlorococcus marinus CUG1431]
MSNTDSLSGKVALITGASRGIGKEIALELSRLGAEVFINYSSSDEKAEEVVNSIKNLGGKAHKLKFDVSKESAVSSAFEEIVKINGTIDILINNAGITRDGLLMRMKSEQWDDVLNTNLKGVFLCTKYASKFMMKKRSGSIVNISSVVGIIGNPGQANYSAAKAGVIGFTKTCAKEFASRGINVNAIAPGFIETEMTEKLNTEEILKVIPLGKLGSCTQIANLVAFLVSSNAGSYITGQTISIDGGMSI